MSPRWLAPITLTVFGAARRRDRQRIGGRVRCDARRPHLRGLDGDLHRLARTSGGHSAGFVRANGPLAFDGTPSAQHVGHTVHIRVTVVTAVPDDIVQSVRLVLPEAVIGNFGENNCSHDAARHQVVTHAVPADGRIQLSDAWTVPSTAPAQDGVCIELLGPDGTRANVPDATPQPWPVAPFLVCPAGWPMAWGAAGTGCLKPK